MNIIKFAGNVKEMVKRNKMLLQEKNSEIEARLKETRENSGEFIRNRVFSCYMIVNLKNYIYDIELECTFFKQH